MKLILLLVFIVVGNPLAANLSKGEGLAVNTTSVQLATGQFIELSEEKGIRRFWDGHAWQWDKSPDKRVHHFQDGQLVKVTLEGRPPLTYTYDDRGRLVRREGGDGRFLELVYDEQGRVIEQKAPLGKEGRALTLAHYIYGPQSVTIYDALNHKKVYHWDATGAITAIEHYLEGELYRVERLAWREGTLVEQTLEDKTGYPIATGGLPGLTQERDLLPSSSITYHDKAGRVVAQTALNGYAESYQWDRHGNLIARTTSRDGKEEKFTYDFMNRLIRESGGFSFEYDLLGQEVKRIDPEGNETDFVYDDLGRLIEILEPPVLDSEDRLIRPLTQLKYNELDQVIEMIDPDGRLIQPDLTPPSLPKNDNSETPELLLPPAEPKESELEESEEESERIERVINERGQKVLQKTYTDPAGLKCIRTFDALGRLEKVEKYDPFGNLLTTKELRYTPGGRKTREVTDGYAIAWMWDGQGRLMQLVEDQGGESEKVTHFAYNKEGKLSALVKPSGSTLYYTYDAAGGLSTLISSDGSIDYHFVWGPDGRLQSACDRKNNTVTTRLYDEKGELKQETLGNGLTVAWEPDALILPDQSRIRYTADKVIRENSQGETLYAHTYSQFDTEGQPAQEELIIKRAQLAPPIYDLDGNAIKIDGHTLCYDALGRLIAVDGIWRYIYDPFGRRIKKIGPEGQETHYLWDKMEEIGASCDQTLQELKVLGPYGAVAIELGQEVWTPLKDRKGSIVELIGPSETPPISPWRYSGKRHDPETGFIYFGARFLDPERAQFLTPDPCGHIDGCNLYQFAHDNPLAFSDTYGHLAVMDCCKSLLNQGWNALLRLNDSANEWRDWLQNMAGLGHIAQKFEEAALIALGKGFLIQSGWYKQAGQTGIFGEKEISPHVRITFNHGILNIRDDLRDNLKQICKSHGGNNVHYIFGPTQGFGWDLLKCAMVKSGYVSPEARELIRIWRGLIDEMGGIQSGGKIIHYTHSGGGSDTWVAINHLTPDEQKMFDIRTFGSATLIPDMGTYTITNYVSTYDAVTPVSAPIDFIRSIFSSQVNIVYVPSSAWIPGPDHPLSVETYQKVLRALGQAFVQIHSGGP